MKLNTLQIVLIHFLIFGTLFEIIKTNAKAEKQKSRHHPLKPYIMKKGTLIILGLFMMVSSVEATNGSDFTNRNRIDYYAYNNAINFFERGIEFFVFPNGDFDFDTRYINRGIRIERDFRGRIRNVGNVFINYDRRGNVRRIGSIFLRYHRGRLVRVGDLRINYNRWNRPVFYGNVRNFYVHNGIRFDINFGDVCDFNDNFFFRNDFRRNYSQFREDRNFYYYKARPNAAIGNRSTIIRRRKANNVNSNANSINRNSRISGYRNTNANFNNSVRRNGTTTRSASITRDTNTNSREVNSNNNRRDRRSISKRNEKEVRELNSTRQTRKNDRGSSRTRRN